MQGDVGQAHFLLTTFEKKWGPCLESAYDARSAAAQCSRFDRDIGVSSRTEDGTSTISLGYMAVRKLRTRKRYRPKLCLITVAIFANHCKPTRCSIYISHSMKEKSSIQTMLANIFVATTALLGLAAHVQGCTRLCCNKIIYDYTPNAASTVSSLGIVLPMYPIGVDCFPTIDFW